MAWSMGLLGASATLSLPAFELIQTTLISSDTASVTFSGLSSYSDYQHLQIRIVSRVSRSTSWGALLVTFNESVSGYKNHRLFGDGTSVVSNEVTNITSVLLNFPATGSLAETGAYGSGVVDILDAFSSTKNKTVRHLTGRHTAVNSEQRICLGSALWEATSPISSITFTEQNGNPIGTGSRFSLYGVR